MKKLDKVLNEFGKEIIKLMKSKLDDTRLKNKISYTFKHAFAIRISLSGQYGLC